MIRGVLCLLFVASALANRPLGGASDLDELSEAMQQAKQLGADYLSKKRSEAGILKKAPSLMQVGTKSIRLSKASVPQEDVKSVFDEKRGPSFNPFKPDPALMKK